MSARVLLVAALLAPWPALRAQERAPQVEGPIELAELLEPIRARHGVPALGAAVVRGPSLVALGATGVRAVGHDARATDDDLWHLGSCTKAMTATVCARLVERGELAWDTTVGEALAEVVPDMHPAWKPATLEQLLAHRAGAPGSLEPRRWAQLWKREGTPQEQRRLLARLVLTQPPERPPGAGFEYSNQGYALAGLMAELAAGSDFEALVARELFAPLGMDAVGFGPPPSGSERVAQPAGHRGEGAARAPVFDAPGSPSDNPPAIAPAGTVHASLASWARFASVHLLEGALPDGARYLRAETVRRLHAAPQGQDYALGWSSVRRSWAGGRALTHAGSNTMWYAVAWLAPERDLGVLVVCNAAGDAAVRACDDAASLMVGLYAKESRERGER